MAEYNNQLAFSLRNGSRFDFKTVYKLHSNTTSRFTINYTGEVPNIDIIITYSPLPGTINIYGIHILAVMLKPLLLVTQWLEPRTGLWDHEVKVVFSQLFPVSVSL